MICILGPSSAPKEIFKRGLSMENCMEGWTFSTAKYIIIAQNHYKDSLTTKVESSQENCISLYFFHDGHIELLHEKTCFLHIPKESHGLSRS